MMTIEEQYNELSKYRQIQPNSILLDKKRRAWEYFRNITDVSNLEKNMRNDIPLYYAPLIQIHGSRMACWPVENGAEIYVDEEFALRNEALVDIQLQHEILHCLSPNINGRRFLFGHNVTNGMESYTGLDEATTQMFAEEIVGIRLDEETDYLYFVKQIMRIMKALFGEGLIAGQYLNNNFDFANVFNNATDYKFEPFVLLMNDVYYLSKDKKYRSLSDEQVKELNNKQQVLLDFVSNLIEQFSKNDEAIVNRICQELQDYSFLEKINLKTIEVSNSVHPNNR